MNNRVIHFEIPSDDPERSMEFFKKVFDWKFRQFGSEPYWVAITGDSDAPGINGAVMKKRDPQQPVVNTISVEDIEHAIKKIEAAGGKIVRPVMPIPSVGWLAFFSDPDGNMHGIMQEDTSAI
jgi:predicted enzyme related to lactoylglutathione lyase